MLRALVTALSVSITAAKTFDFTCYANVTKDETWGNRDGT
jgi:hypothetical protein